MGFMVRVAQAFKFIALFWCAGAVIRMLLALSREDAQAIKVHFVLLVAGVLVYWVAAMLAKPHIEGKAGAIATVKTRWWGASFAFRFAMFLAGAWLIAAWLAQDSYDRDWNWILGPAIGIMVAYWAFSTLVIKREPSNSVATLQSQSRVHEDSAGSASAAPSESNESSADRARAMDDLIKRMKV